jgi:hypothetical protein
MPDIPSADLHLLNDDDHDLDHDHQNDSDDSDRLALQIVISKSCRKILHEGFGRLVDDGISYELERFVILIDGDFVMSSLLSSRSLLF